MNHLSCYPIVSLNVVAAGKCKSLRCVVAGIVEGVGKDGDDLLITLIAGIKTIRCRVVPEVVLIGSPEPPPVLGSRIVVRGFVRRNFVTDGWEISPVTNWSKENGSIALE